MGPGAQDADLGVNVPGIRGRSLHVRRLDRAKFEEQEHVVDQESRSRRQRVKARLKSQG